jgi:type IV secretory pathway VirB2 component (pilin)
MIRTTAGPDGTSLVAASQWVEELVQGRLTTAIAILAVATLGYQMISGRFSARAALRVLLGCFILFGSSTIARGLMDALQSGGPEVNPTVVYQIPPARAPSPAVVPSLAPSTNSGNPFDPYAGNSR